MNGDVQERGGWRGNWRVEPGGKGCAIIRSLRGGTRLVVETLSLRIRAETPNPSEPAEGRTPRHPYVTATGKEGTFYHVRVSSPVWIDTGVCLGL